MADREWQVEVFPVAVDRWVVVLDAPDGQFSTEAQRPDAVEAEVLAAISEMAQVERPSIRLVDSEGQPWTLARAAQQVRVLEG